MLWDKIPPGGDQVRKTGGQSMGGGGWMELKQCRVGVELEAP